jgi:hypothetical protein
VGLFGTHCEGGSLEGNGRLAVSKPIVGELESGETGTMAGETKFQAVAGVDHACSQIDQLLDDGFQTAPLGAMAYRPDGAGQADQCYPP